MPFFSDKMRVRTLLQSEQQECGLACLAMIANAHGHNVDLPYMRSLHQISRGGMSLAELYHLAGQFGLEARGLGVQNIEEMTGLSLPAILHWEGRHYVVLEAIRGSRFIIHDPAVGRRDFSRDDFARHFSGVALEFHSRASFDKIASQTDDLTIWQIIGATTGYKAIFWKIFTVSVAIGILSLSTPILLQISLDFVLPQADVDLLGVLTIGLLALLLFDGVGQWLRDVIILRSSIGMQLQFSRSVVGHGFRLPLTYFEARHAGDFVTRLNSVDQVKAYASDGMIRSFAEAGVSVLSLTLMAYYSTEMTLMVLGTLVLAVGIRMLYMRRTQDATTDALSAKSEEVSVLLDGLNRIQTLKAHNLSERFEQRWFDKLARYAGRDFVSRRLQIDTQLMVHLLVVLGTVVTLYFGVAAVLQSKMTIGMLYAFFALRGTFFQMADALTTNLMHLTVISSHIRRLEDVIQNPPEVNRRTATIRKAIRRSVEVRNLSISFGEEERPVVRNASLTINVERGERIAIVGESGSGKSSLLKVIASIAPATGGGIFVDGQPLGAFGIMEYRNNIGAVFAEDTLFAATVAENVSLFDPEIPRERIEQALAEVGLAEEVEALPQGLATLVSPNNSLLSTGQRRRLLAARIICRRPRLMLFDEITANLDRKTELDLLNVLARSEGGKIFVTHSERVLDYVDRAYSMLDGVLTPLALTRGQCAQEAPLIGEPPPLPVNELPPAIVTSAPPPQHEATLASPAPSDIGAQASLRLRRVIARQSAQPRDEAGQSSR
nr:cysteine peptidase family C39 domain-containing protein [Rhizobium sp. SSA_523]